MDNLISVKELHKYFNGVHILKGINLNIPKGSLVSIIGRSGCGKTTLLRCLNCLEILDSGTITLAGISLNRNPINGKSDIKQSTQIKQNESNIVPFKGIEDFSGLDEDFQIKAHTLRTRVGMLFQALNLFPNMTVLENVMIAPMIVKKESNDNAKLKAIQYLEKVGMEAYLDRMPYQLSGGQAQRVAIARALAMSPQVMLYDEPTSALDPELVEEVINVMTQLNKEGMTQIIVTHSMSLAKLASDIVVFMDKGEIVEIASPKEMFSNPKDQRTRDYLKILLD